MTTRTANTKSAAEWIAHFDEQIALLTDEAEAILSTASSQEGGKWTDEQQQRYDEIMGPAGKENEGLIGQLQADRGRWATIQTRTETAAQNRADQRRGLLDPDGQNAGRRAPAVHTGSVGAYAMGSNRPIIIPSNCRAHRPLPAGMDSPELAYAAGHFYLAALFNWEPSVQFLDQHGIQLQHEIGTPGKGGYLVPTELERSIIAIRELHGIIRSHSRNFPMAAETKDLPKDMGGIVVVPVAEAADMKANAGTSKNWTRPQLVARKWGGYTTFTSELDEDAIIDIGSDLTADFGRAFAKAEDDAGINGDGSASYNQITGLREALLASSRHTTSAGLTPASILLDDYLAVVGMTPNTEQDMQGWYCHKTVWAQSIQPLAQAGGGNTIRDLEAGAATAPGGTGRRPNFMWQGYPGFWSNVMPTAGDFAANLKGVVLFGDLSQGVAFGDRRGVTVRLSEHAEFITDEIGVRGTERFDIIVHDVGTATPTDPAGVVVAMDLPAA